MATKFETKKWELEELGWFYTELEHHYKDLAEEFKKLDEMEQVTEWNRETKEYDLVWEDEEQTIPKMANKWGYVTIPDDELSEEKITRRDICKKLMEYIEKQI